MQTIATTTFPLLQASDQHTSSWFN